jgi:hypothetical protein
MDWLLREPFPFVSTNLYDGSIMTNSIKLTREQGEELDLPWACHTEWSIGSGRWHEHMEGVFEYEGKHYMIGWSMGLTENQEHELPWEWEDEVECFEAEKYEVVKTEWRVKK